MNTVRRTMLLSLLPLSLTCSAIAMAQKISVVVHPEHKGDISSEHIKKIFLGQLNELPDGTEAIPVNLKTGSDIRINFDKELLGKNPSQIKAYWSSQVFTGRGSPPKEVDSSQKCLNMIAENKNVICYIDSTSLNDSVAPILDF